MKKLSVDLKIIGVAHSSLKTTNDAPFQGDDTVSEIEIFEEYSDGLHDIESFSHLHIFYWLHQSEGYSLIVNTPWDIKPHGLFTTRSPHRPNQIGYSIVELINREENKLIVRGLDAIDGTPVIDIKPYVKKLDIKKDAISGWAEHTDLERD